jgi:ferrous iron transport protein B
MEQKKEICVALIGNPNSGKTTVFNLLTGARRHVGNYPGVTVEKVEGHRNYKGYLLRFVDLPGTYSLTAYSPEELIARHFILDEKPEVVVDILDASNLERHLYLATQLMEMRTPLVLALNMSDVAKNQGIEFDLNRLEGLLGARIVPMVASKGEGMNALLDAVIETAADKVPLTPHISYGSDIEAELSHVEKLVHLHAKEFSDRYGSRWVALKLLEGDAEIRERVNTPDLLEKVQVSQERLKTLFGDSPDILIADRRYGFISGACQEAVKHTVLTRHDISDKVDRVLTHRWLGLPIFAVLMYLVFYLTFKLGDYPMAWLEMCFDWLSAAIVAVWPGENLLWLQSLLVDGVIGGVGGVVIFLPNILLLFLSIAFLEDTGYMARAAFIMDRIMHKIGLHGKSFIPMLIGFGCSVPAIMATRILENRRNRLATMLVVPLMSCGARIPIYALLIPAFFPPQCHGPVMWLIYLIGIVAAVVCINLLRRTLLKGESVPFVMELPPYRLPTLKGLFIHMWDRGWMYLKKAGTIILGLSIVLWFLTSFPKPPKAQIEHLTSQEQYTAEIRYSIAGRFGRAIEPAIRPLGFDWKIGTALIGATMAKEVFVSQLSILYSLGDEQDSEETLALLQQRLRADYNPLQGFCIMLFCLLSTPCVATVAITRKESGKWRWALLQFFGLTAMAYIVTLCVFQIGNLLQTLF